MQTTQPCRCHNFVYEYAAHEPESEADASENGHASEPEHHGEEHEHDAMDVDGCAQKLALHVDIPPPTLSQLPIQPLAAGSLSAKGKGKERETSSTLLHASFTSPTLSPPLSPLSPTASLSRAPSTRDAIRKREELIKAKKREARRREAAQFEEGDEDADEDNRPLALHAQRREGGHLSRRRSRSMNDADALRGPVAGSSTHHHHHYRSDNWSSGSGPLDAVPIEDEELPLADTMEREWERLGDGKVRALALHARNGDANWFRLLWICRSTM